MAPLLRLVGRLRGLLALALVAALGACVSPRPAAAPADRLLVLVSLDGFRADYFDRLPTPNLHQLAARGVHAERLVPSFPTKTYPNHFTLVTGKRPEHHGIVANDMLDPESQAWFHLDDQAASDDPRWWLAEPLWVTLERQGVHTAPLLWPGSEGALGGVRPSAWKPFVNDQPTESRLQDLLELLSRPAAERPRFATLYLQNTDDAGHAFGPDSPELAAAVAREDAAVGALMAALDQLGLAAGTDLVVVSDHGMAATSPDRVIWLDDLVEVPRARVVTWSPVLELSPAPADLEPTTAALRRAPHLRVYRREEIPARLHYRDSPRIPPIVAIADEGWQVSTHARAADAAKTHGQHGYDNALPSMGALFVAAGPSFRRGVVVPPFDNVEVYPLLCAALGIAPLPGDWTAAALPAVLRPGLPAVRAVVPAPGR